MSNKYKIVFTFFLCSLFYLAPAQKNMIFRFKGEAKAGIDYKADCNQAGTEIALELPLFGDKNWDYVYNFPSAGFAIGGFYTLESELKPDIAVYTYPYFNYPIIHTPRLALNLKTGAGLGFYPQSVDYMAFEENPDGTGEIKSFGKVCRFTPMLSFGLNMDINLSKRYGNPWAQWAISFGGEVLVFHNAQICRRSCNRVLASGMLGVKYTPNVNPLPIKNKPKKVKKVMALEVGGMAGFNQLSVCDKNNYYLNASINGGLYYPFTNAYRLGLGADAFFNDAYDGTQRKINKQYNHITKDLFEYRLKAGVFLANDFTVENFVAGLHVGLYVYNPVKLPDDVEDKYYENIMYTKLVTKYRITKRFYVTAQIRSHLTQVECAEIGFGWAMPDFGSRVKNPFARLSFKGDDHNELKID